MRKYQTAIFDLDGVIVDTARFHYLAWKDAAGELGLDFTPEQNELLKGVSRMAAMDIIVELSGKSVAAPQRLRLATEKNDRYLQLVRGLTPGDALPGARECITRLKGQGVKITLGSASKNAAAVLERLQIAPLFHVIVDGTRVEKAKPHPAVFLEGAAQSATPPQNCVVFEDAIAGIEAAKRAGMYAVGIGDARVLTQADMVVSRLDREDVYSLFF